MPLSRHSVGTYPETSSHASRQGNIRPLRTDSGIQSGISERELISTYNKQKRERGMYDRTFFQKSSQARKEPPPPPAHAQNTKQSKRD